MITFSALFLLACIEPSGTRITAGDLAPAVPEFLALPATTVVGYAPRPGVTRTFTGPELSRHLAASKGSAATVEAVCVQWRMAPPDPEAFRAAMQNELAPETQLAVIEIGRSPVPPGSIRFPLAGLQPAASGQGAMWRGYVEYAPGLRFDIWARVHVRIAGNRVVAAQDIPVGTRIDAPMVRAESVTTSPGQTGFAARLEDVIGRPALRSLRAGAPIPSAALDKRTDVRKGDTLRVKVSAGSATIGLEATALAHAAAGDIVEVRVNETGRTVRARIAGPGEATIQLSGAN